MSPNTMMAWLKLASLKLHQRHTEKSVSVGNLITVQRCNYDVDQSLTAAKIKAPATLANR